MHAHVIRRQHAVAVQEQQVVRAAGPDALVAAARQAKRGVRVRGELHAKRHACGQTPRRWPRVSSVDPSSVTTSSIRSATPCCSAIDSSARRKMRGTLVGRQQQGDFRLAHGAQRIVPGENAAKSIPRDRKLPARSASEGRSGTVMFRSLARARASARLGICSTSLPSSASNSSRPAVISKRLVRATSGILPVPAAGDFHQVLLRADDCRPRRARRPSRPATARSSAV